MSERLRERRRNRAFAKRADEPEDFAKKAHDLDAARKSVEDAASVSGKRRLIFGIALFYFVINAGPVSHDLLASPLRLLTPKAEFNVELSLVAFFALAPIALVIWHAYTPVHISDMAEKVAIFRAELRKQVPDPEIRVALLRQLPSNFFFDF